MLVYLRTVCSENCMCCHSEIEVADQALHLTQSQYADTGPTSSSSDPMTSGAWQGKPVPVGPVLELVGLVSIYCDRV